MGSMLGALHLGDILKHFKISPKLIFTRGHISFTVAFKGLNVILGLYKCNYSLIRGKELGVASG